MISPTVSLVLLFCLTMGYAAMVLFILEDEYNIRIMYACEWGNRA